MANALPAIPIPSIDATGVSVPTYEQYYTFLTGVAQALYGTDIYLESDSQDGQLLGVLALAFSDMAQAVATAIAAQSPASAVGVGLSNIIKINGLTRQIPQNSTVNMTVVGVVGRTITNGLCADDLGNQWALPASVVFPSGGTITVTATAVNSGPIAAAANSITNIVNPQAGWYSCNNATEAAPGTQVEQDGALRQRQAVSTSLPSQTLTDGLVAALLSLVGVQDVVVYENDTGTTDSNGVPANSIWCVILGGALTDIVTTIAIKKGPGCGLKGSTTGVYNPPSGQPPLTVNYDVPTAVRIIGTISIKVLTSYTSQVGTEIIAAVVAYINNISMTVNVVEWDECIIAGKLVGTNDGTTFRISSLTIGIYGGSQSQADITISAGSKASAQASDFTITVV